MNEDMRFAVRVIASTTTLFASFPAEAQAPASTFGSPAPTIAYTMGDVGRRAEYGSDGAWQTSASSDGSLVIKSEKDAPGWTADVVRSPPLPYTIEIQVRSDIAQVDGHAVGAGAVFGFQRASGSAGQRFFAALIASDTLFVYEMNGSFQQIVRSSQEHVPHGFDRLSITVRKDGFAISMNGNGSLSQSVSGTLTGEFGVIASGSGRAAFRDLVLK